MSEVASTQGSRTQSMQQQPWPRVLRGVIWLVGLVVIAAGIVAVLVVIQGTTAEVRHADAILVLPDTCTSSADASAAPCGMQQLDYALDLYRRGYATQLVLIGQTAVAQEREYLMTKGFPEQALLLEDQEAARQPQLRRVAQLARERGISSMLLVGRPNEMLVGLKMTRDLGLAVYGAPLPGSSALDVPAIVRETIVYWRYVLLGA